MNKTIITITIIVLIVILNVPIHEGIHILQCVYYDKQIEYIGFHAGDGFGYDRFGNLLSYKNVHGMKVVPVDKTFITPDKEVQAYMGADLITIFMLASTIFMFWYLNKRKPVKHQQKKKYMIKVVS